MFEANRQRQYPRELLFSTVVELVSLVCTAETLRHWVRQAECDTGLREGQTTPEREWIKALEREVRKLRQANEILRKASAYFAQAELDRRFKR